MHVADPNSASRYPYPSPPPYPGQRHTSPANPTQGASPHAQPYLSVTCLDNLAES